MPAQQQKEMFATSPVPIETLEPGQGFRTAHSRRYGVLIAVDAGSARVAYRSENTRRFKTAEGREVVLRNTVEHTNISRGTRVHAQRKERPN